MTSPPPNLAFVIGLKRGDTSAMARKETGNETLVGAFLVFGLLMMGYLVVQFGNLGDLFRGTYEV